MRRLEGVVNEMAKRDVIDLEDIFLRAGFSKCDVELIFLFQKG